MNGIAIAHFNYLQRRYPVRKHTYIIFALAGVVALIPLLLYITDERGWMLPLLAIPIYTVQGIMSFRSLSLVSSDHFGASLLATDDSAVPVPLTAHQLVIAQWRSLTAYLWRQNAPLVLLKLWLAIGVAQWLHNMQIYTITYTTSMPFFQQNYPCAQFLLSGNICYFTAAANLHLMPPWWQIILGTFVLASFTYLEGAFMAALGVCLSLWLPNSRLRFAFALFTRLFLIVASLVIWVRVWALEETLNIPEVHQVCFWSMPGCSYPSDYYNLPQDAGKATYDLSYDWQTGTLSDMNTVTDDPSYMVGIMGEYVRLAAWTSVDGGVLMTGTIMRPAFGPLYILYVNGAFFLFSLATYWSLITVLLALARRFARRRGMLPSTERPWHKKILAWL
jgi:hypothetical protein